MFYYFELVLMVLFPLFVITQLIIPAFKGTPTFSFFRRVFGQKRAVEEEIRELEATIDVVKLNKRAKKLKKMVEKEIKDI